MARIRSTRIARPRAHTLGRPPRLRPSDYKKPTLNFASFGFDLTMPAPTIVQLARAGARGAR